MLNDNISTITAETRDLRTTLATTQQHLAQVLVGQKVCLPAVPPPPPPPLVYAPPPAPVYAMSPYAPTPPTHATYTTDKVEEDGNATEGDAGTELGGSLYIPLTPPCKHITRVASHTRNSGVACHAVCTQSLQAVQEIKNYKWAGNVDLNIFTKLL